MKALFLCFALEAAFLILMLFIGLKWATIVFGTGALLVATYACVYVSVCRIQDEIADRKQQKQFNESEQKDLCVNSYQQS
jgi:hypothetical protein